MFHELEGHGNVVVGRQIAVEQFLGALSEFGQSYDYVLYPPARHAPALKAHLALAPRVSIGDRAELAPEAEFAAWHELQLECFLPFALRDQIGGRYPITVVHHTVSYKEYLHDQFLRLLLAEPQPHDAFVCTSTAARDAIANIVDSVADAFNERYGTKLHYRGRYEVIPLGTDVEHFKPLDQREARARFDLADDDFVLLWIGRLSLIDKCDLLPLIDAFAELVQKNSGRSLTLVCAGTQRPGEQFGDVLQDYARGAGVGDRVRIITDQKQYAPWMPELYSAADVFVSPVDNVQESFGLTPVEALACGVPQVVSDWSGYRDTVVDGHTGFLVPTYWAACHGELDDMALLTEPSFDHLVLASSVAIDSRALIAAVQRLIDDPELRRSMSRAPRERAVEHYSWAGVITRYEALWSELAAGAKEVSARPRSYALPNYGRFFAGFPTRHLSESCAIRLTDRGRALLHEPEFPCHYNAQFRYLDLSILKRIIAGLVRFDAKDEALDVGRVVAVLTRKDPRPHADDIVLRHLMWLLKYGFVAIER